MIIVEALVYLFFLTPTFFAGFVMLQDFSKQSK